MSSSLWAISMAGGLETRRLAAVMRSWAGGIDGACVVLGPDDPPLPELPYPTRTVRTPRPFSRSSWRNIAARFAPAERVAALDADCVLLGPQKDFRQRTIDSLGPCGSRRIVAYTFAWGEQGSVEHILAGGDLAQAAWRPTGYQVSGTTGQLAFWRGDAVELSWNDDMLGWGAEDSEMHWRAERSGFVTTWLSSYLGHVYHPRRPARARMSKRQNLRIARQRRESAPSIERALREIAMLPLRVGFDAPESLDEGTLRRLVREQCEREGWPAFEALQRGEVASGCLYEPVLGASILDKT